MLRYNQVTIFSDFMHFGTQRTAVAGPGKIFIQARINIDRLRLVLIYRRTSVIIADEDLATSATISDEQKRLVSCDHRR